MDLMLLRAFQTQVALQCQFMLKAAEDMKTGLRQGDTTHVFYALQNLLNASANVSKALWGQGGRYEEVRRPLRESIGIDDNSALREVTMRNNFEHFDERLDRWWQDSKQHIAVDLNILPNISGVGVAPIDQFRVFDPTTLHMTFWGQEFDIQSIINEARRILPTVEAESTKPWF